MSVTRNAPIRLDKAAISGMIHRSPSSHAGQRVGFSPIMTLQFLALYGTSKGGVLTDHDATVSGSLWYLRDTFGELSDVMLKAGSCFLGCGSFLCSFAMAMFVSICINVFVKVLTCLTCTCICICICIFPSTAILRASCVLIFSKLSECTD
jgi:hypothetical protein